jgi:outer membrane biosynthesis protein TonB
MFLNVNPAQAVAEPPKDARYYSDKNSRAANPDANKDVGIPQITGNQTEVAKTEDVPREKFTPLQPARPAPAQPALEQQPEMKAKPTAPPGDLTMAKPDPNPRKDEGKDQHTRPRTIEEAKARQQQDNRIPGQKMKQEGGVKRHLELSSLDAKATPFGAYDAALVEAISQRWFSLLDERGYASDSHGKVVLHFVLHPDGRVSDMTVAQNTSGEVWSLICQQAVLGSAPFDRWPDEMRRIVGETRSIQFTFYYN